jgi:hypothetical protein
MNITEALSDVHDDFAEFWRGLGFVVTWDYDRKGKWYEILSGDRLLLQVDFEVTLTAFVEDLPLLAEGKNGTSNVYYEIRGPLEAAKQLASAIHKKP